jgi:hypothetical protein
MLLDWILADDVPISLGHPRSINAGFFIRLELLETGFLCTLADVLFCG